MTTEVASNEWGDVIRHDLEEILELRWLASSAQMTDDDFKATLELFAAEQEKVRLPSLLIDATEFRHEFGEGVMEWRDREIIPRYGRAGTVRLAFHVPAGVPGVMEAGGEPVVEGSATFPTAWFAERRHALDWLRGG